MIRLRLCLFGKNPTEMMCLVALHEMEHGYRAPVHLIRSYMMLICCINWRC